MLDSTVASLPQFAADPTWLGGNGTFTLVLHTRMQDVLLHPYVHAVMACGALDRDDSGNPHGKPILKG